MVDQFQTKFTASRVSDNGRFHGYGAVFNNIDSHGDIITPGAFATSLREWRAKGRWPTMRLMHGSSGNPFAFDDLPVGRWISMTEDRHGLYVEGELLALTTDQGQRLLSLMKAGVLDGLSIGYIVKRSRPGARPVKRYLEAVDLREVSLVDEPSNDLARVSPPSANDLAADKFKAALFELAAEPTPQAADDRAYDRMLAALRAASTN